MEVGLRRGAEGDLQCRTVKCQAIGEDGGRPVGTAHSNPLLDSRQYEVEQCTLDPAGYCRERGVGARESERGLIVLDSMALHWHDS